jgi:hypothetical protein
MGWMDENPYQSPRYVPDAEKPPVKPRNRYFNAVSSGLAVGIGLTLSQYMGLTILETPLNSGFYLFHNPGPMFVTVAVIAIPVGMAIGLWTWRVPDSKGPVVATLLLGLSPNAMLVFMILHSLARPPLP